MRETWVRSLGREDPLEKEMATHSSILAWRIPWTEEPGGLQSMGSQRVGHDWVTSLHFTLVKAWKGEVESFLTRAPGYRACSHTPGALRCLPFWRAGTASRSSLCPSASSGINQVTGQEHQRPRGGGICGQSEISHSSPRSAHERPWDLVHQGDLLRCSPGPDTGSIIREAPGGISYMQGDVIRTGYSAGQCVSFLLLLKWNYHKHNDLTQI